MRTINTSVRALAGPLARREAIAFFCECQNSNCCSTVWMTAEAFDTTIAGHTGWMLFSGHEPSVSWHTRELPPVPETHRSLRAVSGGNERASYSTGKDASVSPRQRFAQAS